jgi:hypothetical protein
VRWEAGLCVTQQALRSLIGWGLRAPSVGPLSAPVCEGNAKRHRGPARTNSFLATCPFPPELCRWSYLL